LAKFGQILYLQMYFWVFMQCSWEGAILGEESGIYVLAGLGPSSQTVGTLFRTPWPEKPANRTWKKWVQWIQFNMKIQSTTFGKTNSAKVKKIRQTFVLLYHLYWLQFVKMMRWQNDSALYNCFNSFKFWNKILSTFKIATFN